MTYNDLFKMLLSDNPGIKIKENEELVFALIPELKKCVNFNQHSTWHPYFLYEHILYALNFLEKESNNDSNNLIMALAVLFHDFGKLYTLVIDNQGRGHFPDHWLISADIFDKYSSIMELDEGSKKTIFKLIKYHEINLEKLSEKEKISILSQFNKDEITMLYKIKRADKMAQSAIAQVLIPMLNEQEKEILSQFRINRK